MERTNINPAILQEFLDSAPNARDKGQSQFFTPVEFARQLATALPRFRPVITDLNCGRGDLLQGCANDRTAALLGLDIDPGRLSPAPLRKSGSRGAGEIKMQKITRDVTLACTRLHEVNWRAPLFVLNPPWSLYWWKDRLECLAESECSAVRDAVAATDPRAPRPGGRKTIEADVAMLAMALHFSERHGEGLLIANHSTLNKKLFDPGAPYRSLARHVWARLIIPGNPMTGLDHCNFQRKERQNSQNEHNGESRNNSDHSVNSVEPSEFKTEVIYFARDHEQGPQQTVEWDADWQGSRGEREQGRITPAPPLPLSPALPLPDRSLRHGAEIREWGNDDHTRTTELWSAVKDQCKADTQASGRPPGHPFHLWLNIAGVIQVHLSRFEEASVKVDKNEAKRLHDLQGQRPMQLVMQRAQRNELLHVAEKAGWCVDPALLKATQDAILAYHSARAPLAPLPEIQRLGHCDEVDFMQCKSDLALSAYALIHCEECDYETTSAGRAGAAAPPSEEGPCASTCPRCAVKWKEENRPGDVPTLIHIIHEVPKGITAPLFKAGQSYPLRTQTVKVKRTAWKPNTIGQLEKLEYEGQELAMYLTAVDGWEYCFMDGTLRHGHTKVDVTKVVVCSPTPLHPLTRSPAQGKAGENGGRGERGRKEQHPTIGRSIDFTLQELIAHFIIPEVPDVAQCQPEAYKLKLNMLDQIEQLTTQLTLEKAA